MKQVLIIEESIIFREYLRYKFEERSVEVITAISFVDGTYKMRNIVPDLIIMDYNTSFSCTELLRQKMKNPNTVNIPVIFMSHNLHQKQLVKMIPYNAKKVLTKPVKVDALFAAVSEIIGIPFIFDETLCIVEIHVSDGIIFVEFARGINIDKIDLVRFKIAEIIALHEIKTPRIILMLSAIKLGFADAPNIEKLLDTIIQISKINVRHIRVLTKNVFLRQFISAHREYGGLEVAPSLNHAVSGLLIGMTKHSDQTTKMAEFICENLIAKSSRDTSKAITLTFENEYRDVECELVNNMIKNLRVAVIDDDLVIQELIKTTFQKKGAAVTVFSNGEEYFQAMDKEKFDIVFLDINMPQGNGLDVLQTIKSREFKSSIIALSTVARRETMIKAVTMGVRSYFIKPVEADEIFKKSVEILRANL